MPYGCIAPFVHKLHAPVDIELMHTLNLQAWGPLPEEAPEGGRDSTGDISASIATSSEFNHSYTVPGPVYQDAWSEVFISERYRPTAIRIMSIIMSVYFVGNGTIDWLGDPGHKGEWGGYHWMMRSAVVRPLGGVVSFLFAILFVMPVCQPFCVRYHDQLCIIWLCKVFLTQMVIFLVSPPMRQKV